MSKEKTYFINRSKIPSYRKEVEVKESELTEQDVVYLWNKLVKTFNDSPTGLQVEFTRQLHDVYEKKIQEAIKKQQDENIGTEGENKQGEQISGITEDAPASHLVN